MDYSLLIGVHNEEYEVNEKAPVSNGGGTKNRTNSFGTEEDDRLLVSKVVGPKSYYMGIIDFQQKYDYGKLAERMFKVFALGADPDGLSCIEPGIYRERFMQKMKELTGLYMVEGQDGYEPPSERSTLSSKAGLMRVDEEEFCEG